MNEEKYGDGYICKFDLPEIGPCEIVIKPYKEYPIFFIEKLQSRELVSVISMVDHIYITGDSVHLNADQKLILIDELNKYTGDTNNRWRIWDIMRIYWICSNDTEPGFDIYNIPDYTLLPD